MKLSNHTNIAPKSTHESWRITAPETVWGTWLSIPVSYDHDPHTPTHTHAEYQIQRSVDSNPSNVVSKQQNRL